MCLKVCLSRTQMVWAVEKVAKMGKKKACNRVKVVV